MSSLVDALTAKLKAWDLLTEPEAVAALDLARRLDDRSTGATSAAMLHAQLGARLADLRTLAPEAETADAIDEMKAKLHLMAPGEPA